MPITYDEAYAQTNPNDPDAVRDAAAKALQLGVAANDIYWSHRPMLEQIQAHYEGHGQVIRRGEEDATPTTTVTAAESTPDTLEGAATVSTEDTLRKQLLAAGIQPEA